MKKIKYIADDIWKIVLVKTIDNKEPIYYRLVNLKTYETEDIPAYRIFDEVMSGKKKIINLSCENNSIVIIDEDGYKSIAELIHIDEFDKEVPNLLTWAIQNGDFGVEVLNRFNLNKNAFSPSNFKISSTKKVAWTCKKGHTIYCGFPTFFSTKCSCPICEAEKNGEMVSLRTWARLTDNMELLQQYDEAEKNDKYSSEIGWKQRNKVWFRKNNEEVSEILYNVTVKNMEPPFSKKNKKMIINLSR